MTRIYRFGIPKYKLSIYLIVATLASMLLASCGPSTTDRAAVDYTPLTDGDWQTSTPGEQGLDPNLIAQLYLDAEDVETIHSLLVVKDGYLVADFVSSLDY